ncbi:hypothetical protein, partial [Escherichia coli]|uniref:hypothetical protein n=1 Tax=Escherichia coli TaxID=562 RepID=UPI0025419F4E
MAKISANALRAISLGSLSSLFFFAFLLVLFLSSARLIGLTQFCTALDTSWFSATNLASRSISRPQLKWSTKTGHRVRVFSSIDFPIRLVVTHHYIRAVLVRCNIQRY